MDLSIIMPWVGAILSFIALGTQLKAILSSGEKKLEERMAKAESKLVEYDRRIQTVESEMKHLPDRDTAHRMEIVIERMAGQLATLDQRLGGQLAALDERMKPVDALGRRLQEFLLDQARK